MMRNAPSTMHTTLPVEKADGSGWDGYRRTDQLRFVIRNGKRVLQQRWYCIWQGKNGEVYPEQWRDVPLEKGASKK